MIDFLHAVDWIVPDPAPAAERFATTLDLPPVRSSWLQTLPTHRYSAVFSRTAPTLAASPTRLEFIAAHDESPPSGECSVAPLTTIAGWQGRRPQRWHATVVCVDDLDEFVDGLRRRGTPVWVETTCEHLPHPRAWVGWSERGRSYVPVFDGGLLLEAIPTSALGGRADPVPEDAGDGTRVARRVHMVCDIDTVLRALATHVGLEPADRVGVDDRLGARVARFGFDHPRGAALEIAEPLLEGPARAYLDRWGEGPFVTTLEVEDPDAVAGRAADHGARRAEGFDGGAVLTGGGLGGALIELVPRPPTGRD